MYVPATWAAWTYALLSVPFCVDLFDVHACDVGRLEYARFVVVLYAPNFSLPEANGRSPVTHVESVEAAAEGRVTSTFSRCVAFLAQ